MFTHHKLQIKIDFISSGFNWKGDVFFHSRSRWGDCSLARDSIHRTANCQDFAAINIHLKLIFVNLKFMKVKLFEP